MSVTNVYLEAGTKILEIVCTTYVNNKKDQRAQRFKLTLKRKVEEIGGRSVTDELSAEFGSDEKMVEFAERWRKISSAPVTKEMVEAA